MEENNPLKIVGNTQNDNKDWWENNPMTYTNWGEKPIDPSLYDIDFYKNLDSTFFSAAKHFSHPNSTHPFSELINFSELKNKAVLEIGCGQGSHAQLFSNAGADYTGIDLTERAIKSTSRRFELNNLPGKILQMDAELMTFANCSFDFVWSWGVIHHSENTEKIIEQIFRVLKPGGKAKIMVYHKTSLRYLVRGGLVEGIIKGKLLSSSLYDINMKFTDGAIASHYSTKELKKMFIRASEIKIDIMDEETEAYIPFFGRYLRIFFPKLMKKVDKHLLSKYGWFIVVEFKK